MQKNIIRMYQLDVDVNEKDEVILSQDRREDGPASGVVIPYDQIEALCGILTKAGELIESRREASNEEDNKEDHGRTASIKERR